MPMKSYLSHAVGKPVIAGVAAGLIDHFVMKNSDIKSNAMFGAAVGAGIFSVSWVEPLVSPMMPSNTPIGKVSKFAEGRIVEIALGSLSSYALNAYVLKNEYTSKEFMYKVGIVALSDIIGETVSELLLLV